MTFYQELQLNQAGSKELLRKSETAQERRYHALIYLAKVAITMLFCFAFVSVFSILFGNENSVVGVVVLLLSLIHILNRLHWITSKTAAQCSTAT